MSEHYDYKGSDKHIKRLAQMVNDLEASGGGGVTYEISIEDHVITLAGSDGSSQSVTVPDDDTSYTFSFSGDTLTIIPSTGAAATVQIPLSGKQNKLTAGEGITIEGDTISAEVLPLSVVDGKLCITFEEV